jgi:HSP20 family protein
MLTTTGWTPWAEVADLQRDVDSLFSGVFADPTRGQNPGVFTPAADVARDGDTWRISLAIPGISADSVAIEIVGRILHVRGERPADGKIQPVVNEIAYGRFERDFALPEDIDAEHVEATYRHGMLELMLPVAEAAKPHRIAVKSVEDGKQLQAA